MDFFDLYKSGYILRIKLAPKSSGCSFRGVCADNKGDVYLKVSVNAVPEKGKANTELLKFLAKTLKVAPKNLDIISGATDHNKKIYLNVPPCDLMTEKLRSLCEGIYK